MSPSPVGDEDLARMLLIRHFEKALLDLYGKGQVSGTVHTCLGQEYIPVALAPLIAGDFVFSNHRGHGHFLALHEDPHGLMAEILGREGGICHGVGGSQHVYLPDRFLSTGVQGQSIPAAVGVAMHLKRNSPGRMAVAFIGDGTFGEGAVYEGLNLAQLWRVPLLVVVENNGIAQTTATSVQMAGTIEARAAAFGIPYHHVSMDDITRIRQTLAPAVGRAREAGSPMIIEFATIRLGPHSKGDDTREAGELAELSGRDWAAGYAAAHPEQFALVDKQQRDRVAGIVAEVLSRPASRWEAMAR